MSLDGDLAMLGPQHLGGVMPAVVNIIWLNIILVGFLFFLGAGAGYTLGSWIVNRVTSRSKG